VILLYCVELEILDNLEAEGRDTLMAEAASAYRARAKALRAAGRAKAADADVAKADKLEADAKKTNAVGPKAKGAASEERELSRQLADLQGKLERMLAEVKRLQVTQANLAPAREPAMGKLELVNAWTGPVTIVVDGVAYPLPAGKSLSLTRPPGDFTYEVSQIQAPVTRKLAAGQTFSIRVAPQAH
jgi:hypothetical protein